MVKYGHCEELFQSAYPTIAYFKNDGSHHPTLDARKPVGNWSLLGFVLL
jgi:hypothetical protein